MDHIRKENLGEREETFGQQGVFINLATIGGLSEDDRGTQQGNLISILWFFNKESRLKVNNQHIQQNKLRGFSPQVNYADRATAACWRS
jgi:hypothetical protein